MGFRNRFKNKRDANEPEIVETLEAYGFSVERLDTPLDLICGYQGRDYLVEVKQPLGTFTGPQEVFFENWKGSKTILRSVEDAQAWAEKIKRT